MTTARRRLELGSAPADGPSYGIPWSGGPRPPYPLESWMTEPEQPDQDPRPAEPDAPTDAEPDSLADIVARVRRLERIVR